MNLYTSNNNTEFVLLYSDYIALFFHQVELSQDKQEPLAKVELSAAELTTFLKRCTTVLLAHVEVWKKHTMQLAAAITGLERKLTVSTGVTTMIKTQMWIEKGS